jgi:hypothetical protein
MKAQTTSSKFHNFLKLVSFLNMTVRLCGAFGSKLTLFLTVNAAGKRQFVMIGQITLAIKLKFFTLDISRERIGGTIMNLADFEVCTPL